MPRRDSQRLEQLAPDSWVVRWGRLWLVSSEVVPYPLLNLVERPVAEQMPQSIQFVHLSRCEAEHIR